MYIVSAAFLGPDPAAVIASFQARWPLGSHQCNRVAIAQSFALLLCVINLWQLTHPARGQPAANMGAQTPSLPPTITAFCQTAITLFEEENLTGKWYFCFQCSDIISDELYLLFILCKTLEENNVVKGECICFEFLSPV